VTLARPEKANAMDAEITDALLEIVLSLRDDTSVRAMMLTGQGTAFSAGGDITTIAAMREDPRLRDAVLAAHQELFWAMTRLPFPTVAAVNGAAVGAGVTVALLCDLVVMAEDAFLCDPRVSLGLLDGAGGFVLWPLLTSLSAAKEHLLLGDRVTGTEAHRIGLANRAVPAADVLAEARGLADRLAALPPQAVRLTRQLLNSHIDRAATILGQCAQAENECFDTEEHGVLLAALSARVAAKNARAT
jgi:enoyl-CoA hydratase